MSFENSLACLLSALMLQFEDSPHLRGRVWILILWLRRCRFHVEQPLIGTTHLFWLRLKLVEVQLAQVDSRQLLRRVRVCHAGKVGFAPYPGGHMERATASNRGWLCWRQ